MRHLKEQGKQALARLGAVPHTCAVKGCSERTEDTIDVLALNPIDHDATLLQLCQNHLKWAEERNELAREIKAELVEARKDIGQDRISEIEELAVPQGSMRRDILMGEACGMIPLSEAVDEPGTMNGGFR